MSKISSSLIGQETALSIMRPIFEKGDFGKIKKCILILTPFESNANNLSMGSGKSGPMNIMVLSPWKIPFLSSTNSDQDFLKAKIPSLLFPESRKRPSMCVQQIGSILNTIFWAPSRFSNIIFFHPTGAASSKGAT